MKKKTREDIDREFWETFNLDPMRYALEGLRYEQDYRRRHGLPPVLLDESKLPTCFSLDVFDENKYKFERQKGSKNGTKESNASTNVSF